MPMHDSPHFNPNGFQEDFADYVGGPPVDTPYEEPNFADAAGAPNEWILGELHGDVATPNAPMKDPVVGAWTLWAYPRLTIQHDAILNGLGSYFTAKGGWVYVTQDQIANIAGVNRATVNRRLPDLIKVGLVESRPVSTQDGKRGMAYRLAGEECGWQAVHSEDARRTTVEAYLYEMRIAQVENALSFFIDNGSVVTEMPDNVVAVVRDLRNSEKSEIDLFNSGPKGHNPDTTKAVITAGSYNGLRVPNEHRPPTPASESQVNLIEKQMQRTGLEETDVLASWPDVDRYSQVPQGLDPTVMTSLQANRCIQWLTRQADKPAAEVAPEHEAVCTCAHLFNDAQEPDEAAQSCWIQTLEQLEEELPAATFETWLKPTRVIAFKRPGPAGGGAQQICGRMAGATDVPDHTARPASVFRAAPGRKISDAAGTVSGTRRTGAG